MQLVAFSAVLWSISHTLVAFPAVYALLGTFGALYLFGAPLIRLNFWQIRREADFRFGLMRLRENAESIAFYRGVAGARQLNQRFEAVFSNFAKLIKKQRSLNLYQRGFSQLTLVLPAIILANDVLSGELEVGRAIQAAGAFAAVLAAVSLIVDNFESLSRFVAGIDRLHALSQVVLKTPAAPTPWAEPPTSEDAAPAPHDGAQIVTREGDTLALERADAAHAAVWPSARCRICPSPWPPETPCSSPAPAAAAKARCCARWQGCGAQARAPCSIRPLQTCSSCRSAPIQPDTLRSQIIYPSQATELTDDQLLELLDEVQLRLRWLNAWVDSMRRTTGKSCCPPGEQQRLAFARVLARTPRIVILDEATSALDSANEAALYERLRATGMALVSIAHRPAVLRHHTQVLQLKGDGAWQLVAAADFSFDE